MIRLVITVLLALLLTTASHASSVVQKSYAYRHDLARDTGSDREFVISDETPRTPLVREPKPLNLFLKFGAGTNESPELSLQAAPSPAASTAFVHSSSYHLEKTIHFGFDSATVNDTHGVSLLASSLKSDPTVTSIRVMGFTCDLGPKPYNDRLATRRAVAVGNLLRLAGLRVDDISGQGKCCYLPGPRSFSRRAEISIMRSPEKDTTDEK